MALNVPGVEFRSISDAPKDRGRFLIHGPQGSGKRLPVDTPVLTPTGWTPIGDLRVGDQVIGVDGRPYPVYGVTKPVTRPTYRVTLNDGGTVEADGEHLWEVCNRKGNRAVLDTDQIADGLQRGSTYTLPRCAAVQHDPRNLLLDPYLVGALLADGHLHGRTVVWTKNREETVRRFRMAALGFDLVDEQPQGAARRQRFRVGSDDLLRKSLDELGLRVPSADKFIPEEYLLGSADQRTSLLHGLFDGDGRLTGKGQPVYSSTSYRLAQDVQRLCWSLGIGANLSDQYGDGTWRVTTVTPCNPFETAEHTPRHTGYSESRRIVSVKPIGDTEGLCIAVDSPRNLYVTKDYIVTHNSTLASTIAEAGSTLFIDLVGEKGTRSFQGAPYASNITLARPKSVTAMDDLFWQLKAGGHGFNAVVIDSLTSVQKMTMRYLLGHDETAVREIQQGTAPADIRTWGQALDVMVDTATFWYGLADGDLPEPMHVVMTAQTKVVEADDGLTTTRTPDVQKGALSMVLAAPDYVLYTDVEDNPDFLGDDTQPPVHHIVRFGSHPGYRTKARVPVNLRGKIPPVLGRTNPTSLVTLSRVLGIGGVPAAPKKKKAAAPAAADTNTATAGGTTTEEN